VIEITIHKLIYLFWAIQAVVAVALLALVGRLVRRSTGRQAVRWRALKVWSAAFGLIGLVLFSLNFASAMRATYVSYTNDLASQTFLRAKFFSMRAVILACSPQAEDQRRLCATLQDIDDEIDINRLITRQPFGGLQRDDAASGGARLSDAQEAELKETVDQLNTMLRRVDEVRLAGASLDSGSLESRLGMAFAFGLFVTVALTLGFGESVYQLRMEVAKRKAEDAKANNSTTLSTPPT
jgi:hypothetical protein